VAAVTHGAARALLGALVIVACTERTGTDDLSMSISARPATLTSTQVATVRFTAGNVTDQAITIRFVNSCRFTYEVRNPNGSVIDETVPAACSGPAQIVEIPPFGALIDSVPWPSSASRPPAGRYTVRGFLGDDRRRSAGPLTIVLE
jgi:hypothetical protein